MTTTPLGFTIEDLDAKVALARQLEMQAWNKGDSRTATRYREVCDTLLDMRWERTETDAMVEQPTP
jgi:hypothetical protein